MQHTYAHRRKAPQHRPPPPRYFSRAPSRLPTVFPHLNPHPPSPHPCQLLPHAAVALRIGLPAVPAAAAVRALAALPGTGPALAPHVRLLRLLRAKVLVLALLLLLLGAELGLAQQRAQVGGQRQPAPQLGLLARQQRCLSVRLRLRPLHPGVGILVGGGKGECGVRTCARSPGWRHSGTQDSPTLVPFILASIVTMRRTLQRCEFGLDTDITCTW
ncbi:hypothetical protein F751_0571 [Auxenochlorella protothecoides]|uniref:Uncharacterized protein n=1 Tax=Auxenochlorella protothecoides TaxID=3075 RepID=A0A087SIJ0_AUXPR|nr:hypothetical protein F751_0571 [Auxenochlorella protothecoides]KFM25544.1 hypothetical protein F751_0571 [Auxenochlorella protothecoides]